MEKLLNLIFIPECVFCKKIGSFFCNDCLGKCKKLDQAVLFKKTGVKCLFAYEYEGLIRECIRNAKYKNKHLYIKSITYSNTRQYLIIIKCSPDG